MFLKKIKRICSILFFSFLCTMILYGIIPAYASDQPPDIKAYSAILMDAYTGQVYYAKDGNKQRSPASLTKLMTAILAVENGKPDDLVTITQNAAAIYVGSIIDLDQKDRLTLDNLLKAALIVSANDSTVAIAEHIGGSEESFIFQMNRKAMLLGAKNTRFANTNGYYDSNHYTTAYDLGLIACWALTQPYINELISTRETVIQWKEPIKEREVRNTNHLLRDNTVEGIDGVKTGTTDRAGKCLIASATRGDKRLIAVVLHAEDRNREAAALLEYGFDHVHPITICPGGKKITQVNVAEGVKATVPLTIAKPVRIELTKEQQTKIKMSVQTNAGVVAPVQKGQILGKATFTIDNYPIVCVPLVASREEKQLSWWNKVKSEFTK